MPRYYCDYCETYLTHDSAWDRLRDIFQDNKNSRAVTLEQEFSTTDWQTFLPPLPIANVLRYYCDYCDTYLTHDSPSVRKQHNAGYKHKANVRLYYQKFEEEQSQIMIDQKIKERLGQAAAYQQIGAAYNQHLAAFPGQRPCLPMIPPPMLPVPGAMPPQLMAGARPPMFPPPVPAASGYSAVPPIAPIAGQMPPVSSLPMQPNTLPAPPALNPLAGVPGGAAPPTLGSAPIPATQSIYQPNPNGIAVSSANVTTTS